MQDFIKISDLNRKLDPFYKERSSLDFLKGLLEEIDELNDEINNGTRKNLQSEMGDVLWDVFNLFNKLEDEGRISKNEVFDEIIKKMSSRKTFLLENREVTKNEAMQIWNNAKKLEGCDDSRLRNENY